MPYSSLSVYELPAGSHGVPNTVISSTKFNTTIDDLEGAQNAARPISAGGTGATTAVQALDNLGALPRDGSRAMTGDLDLGGYTIVNDGTTAATGGGPNYNLTLTVRNGGLGNRSEQRILTDLYPITTQFNTTYLDASYPAAVIRIDPRLSVNQNALNRHFFATGTTTIRQVSLEACDFFLPYIIGTATTTEIDIFFGREATLDEWTLNPDMVRIPPGCWVEFERFSTGKFTMKNCRGLYGGYLYPLATATTSTSYNARQMMRRIPVDTTAGAVTITLPSPTSLPVGLPVEVTRIAGANNVTVVRSGGGAFTSTITANGMTGHYEIVGTDWAQIWKSA